MVSGFAEANAPHDHSPEHLQQAPLQGAPLPKKTFADLVRSYASEEMLSGGVSPVIPRPPEAQPKFSLSESEREREKWKKIYKSYRSVAQIWWDQAKVFDEEASTCRTIAKQEDEMACALYFRDRNEGKLALYEMCINLRQLLGKHAIFFLKKYLYHCSHVPVIRSLKILTGIVRKDGIGDLESAFLQEMADFFRSEKMDCPEMKEVDGSISFRFIFQGRKKFGFLEDNNFKRILLSEMKTSLRVDHVEENLVKILERAVRILNQQSLLALIEQGKEEELLSRIAFVLNGAVNEAREEKVKKSNKNKRRDMRRMMNLKKNLDPYFKANELTLVSEYFFAEATILENMASEETQITSNEIFEKWNVDMVAKYEVVLDIHGFHEVEADLFAKRELYHCANIPAIKSLIFITGKRGGYSIINAKVQEVLANDPRKFRVDQQNTGRLEFRFDGISNFNFFVEDANFKRILFEELVYPMWW